MSVLKIKQDGRWVSVGGQGVGIQEIRFPEHNDAPGHTDGFEIIITDTNLKSYVSPMIYYPKDGVGIAEISTSRSLYDGSP